MSAPARLGSPRVHARVLSSTNDRARQLALAGAPHGTLVTADLQLAGRGRQGRRWSAPAGGALLLSIVLRASEGARESPAPITLAAAVAVTDAVGPGALIKWPNDIVLLRAGKPAKLAGILAESRPRDGFTVLGIGLNTSLRLDQLEQPLRDRAATLGLPESAREELLGRLLQALDERLTQPAARTLDAWRARDLLAGREISWAAGRGTARDVDERGRLVVVLADGSRTALDAGEVHLDELAQPSQELAQPSQETAQASPELAQPSQGVAQPSDTAG